MTYTLTEPADLPLPYQADPIARGEMAERLRVAEAEAERLRARTTELAAVRGGVVLRPMEIAPKTGEHIIVVGDLTGIGFGWSGPNRSRQSWADVVHWYGWEEGGEPSGWYSSSYGGEEQQKPFEQPLRGWLPIPETGLLANPRMAVMCMEESDGDGTRTYMGEAPVYSVQTMPAPTPEGKVLVDAGELAVLRATIAKLKEFHDPVNVAKRIEEYAAQHKPAQREVVPNRTGGWFMEGDQGQRTTTAANASQHPGQGGKAGDHA